MGWAYSVPHWSLESGRTDEAAHEGLPAGVSATSGQVLPKPTARQPRPREALKHHGIWPKEPGAAFPGYRWESPDLEMALTFLWTDSKAWQAWAGSRALCFPATGSPLRDWLALVTRSPAQHPCLSFLSSLGSKSELSASVGLGFSLSRG